MGILAYFQQHFEKFKNAFSWGKFAYQFIVLAILIGSFVKNIQQEELLNQSKQMLIGQGKLIEEQKKEIDSLQGRVSNLIVFFEDVQLRVRRERGYFYKLVTIEINELRKVKGLLYQINSLSEAEVLAKYGIKLLKVENNLDKYYHDVINLQKDLDTDNHEYMDFWDAVQLEQRQKILTQKMKKNDNKH